MRNVGINWFPLSVILQKDRTRADPILVNQQCSLQCPVRAVVQNIENLCVRTENMEGKKLPPVSKQDRLCDAMLRGICVVCNSVSG